MKKVFSTMMVAAAVALVALSSCGDASGNASEDATEEAAN